MIILEEDETLELVNHPFDEMPEEVKDFIENTQNLKAILIKDGYHPWQLSELDKRIAILMRPYFQLHIPKYRIVHRPERI